MNSILVQIEASIVQNSRSPECKKCKAEFNTVNLSLETPNNKMNFEQYLPIAAKSTKKVHNVPVTTPANVHILPAIKIPPYGFPILPNIRPIQYFMPPTMIPESKPIRPAIPKPTRIPIIPTKKPEKIPTKCISRAQCYLEVDRSLFSESSTRTLDIELFISKRCGPRNSTQNSEFKTHKKGTMTLTLTNEDLVVGDKYYFSLKDITSFDNIDYESLGTKKKQSVSLWVSFGKNGYAPFLTYCDAGKKSSVYNIVKIGGNSNRLYVQGEDKIHLTGVTRKSQGTPTVEWE